MMAGSASTNPLLFVFAAGLAPNASAAGPHSRHRATKQPGVAAASVKAYKLDAEVSRRASRGNPLHTTSVIVTLVPGAVIPTEFKRFARADKLDIINGVVLDVRSSGHRREAHGEIGMLSRVTFSSAC